MFKGVDIVRGSNANSDDYRVTQRHNPGETQLRTWFAPDRMLAHGIRAI